MSDAFEGIEQALRRIRRESRRVLRFTNEETIREDSAESVEIGIEDNRILEDNILEEMTEPSVNDSAVDREIAAMREEMNNQREPLQQEQGERPPLERSGFRRRVSRAFNNWSLGARENNINPRNSTFRGGMDNGQGQDLDQGLIINSSEDLRLFEPRNPPADNGNLPGVREEEVVEEFSTPRWDYSVPGGSLLMGNFTPENPLNRENRLLKEKLRESDRKQEELRQTLEEICQAWGQVNSRQQPGVASEHFQRDDDDHEDYLKLKAALDMVRNFNGESSEKLESFLRSCETARDMTHPSKRSKLLFMISGSKLEGKALIQLKHKTVSTFEELRRELEALFGKSKSLIGLQVDFNKLQQRPEEDVSKFAARAERVTMELIEAIQSVNADLDESGRGGLRRGILTLAKANFEQGLQGQLQILVRAGNFKTLHESCIGAVELEKTISSNNPKNKSEGTGASGRKSAAHQQAMTRRSVGLGCFNCGQKGHVVKDCKLARDGT